MAFQLGLGVRRVAYASFFDLDIDLDRGAKAPLFEHIHLLLSFTVQSS